MPQIDIEEGQSVFWIFIQEDGLYRFDNRTFQTTRVLDLSEVTVLPLHSGSDGEIYFRTFEYDSQVYKFSYPEGALEEVEIPETGWYGRTSILVDRKLNLWLSGFGWRDPSGEWHLLHPRATEILRFPENFSPYELPSPKIIYESSNGWLWFAKYEEFDNGTAWFNPETGEGCWFTTRSQEVVEDTEGRMWIATDGKLYSLDLYP